METTDGRRLTIPGKRSDVSVDVGGVSHDTITTGNDAIPPARPTMMRMPRSVRPAWWSSVASFVPDRIVVARTDGPWHPRGPTRASSLRSGRASRAVGLLPSYLADARAVRTYDPAEAPDGALGWTRASRPFVGT